MNLTVALCVYNCEKYIIETLECIESQTCKDFKLIFYNDASTDNTQDLIVDFCKRYALTYEMITGDVNKGLAYGRSFIENYVDTKYLLFVDGDDCPRENLVSELYSKITSDDDLIAVGCYHKFIDSDSNLLPGGIYIGSKSKEEFIDKASRSKLIFMQPTAIIDLKYLRKAGGRNILGFPVGKPRYQDLCEDLDLWCRMSDFYSLGKAIVVIPEVLCHYRKHQDSLSANSFGMIIRMKHIKNNLKLRRAGLSDISFIEFCQSLTENELNRLSKMAASADALKRAAFYLKRRKICSFFREILLCLYNEPSYLLQKIKSNSGFFK